MRRFGSLQLVSCGACLGAALLNDGSSLRDLVGHLGNFELGQKLSFADTVTEIDFDRSHIAGHFGHHIHFLKRLKLGREYGLAGDAGPGYPATGTTAIGDSSVGRSACMAASGCEQDV